MGDDQYQCIPLFREKLFISVPPAHRLALFKEISFTELNGENILILSRIGQWYDICLKMLPESHLLLQENNAIYDVLTKESALPIFRTNITIKRDNEEVNRVTIPIIDKAAELQFYAIFDKTNMDFFPNRKSNFFYKLEKIILAMVL